MPTRLRTNILSEQEMLDSDAIATRPIHIVSHDLAILDDEDDSFNPYDSAPRLSDNQLESKFGRRFPKGRK